MSSLAFEAFLARLYGDEEFVARFLAAPGELLADTSLNAGERAALLAIDPLELQLACRSFAAKRRAHGPRSLLRRFGRRNC